MKLIAHELKAAGLLQTLEAPKDMLVVAIRPHLYRHHFATGSLKIQVLDNSDVLLTESEVIDIADIGSLNFFHGSVRFLVSLGMTKNTTYKIQLVGLNGYSFNESAFIGWCNGFDLGVYPETYSPSTNLKDALNMEIWEKRAL